VKKNPKIRLLDGHLDVRVGPAALEAGTTLTRRVIQLHADDVFAWRAEGGRYRHLARFAVGRGTLGVERHGAGSSELVQGHGKGRRRCPATSAAWLLERTMLVGAPERQRYGLSHRSVERVDDADRRPGHDWSAFHE